MLPYDFETQWNATLEIINHNLLASYWWCYYCGRDSCGRCYNYFRDLMTLKSFAGGPCKNWLIFPSLLT